jgi:hypothetical protein
MCIYIYMFSSELKKIIFSPSNTPAKITVFWSLFTTLSFRLAGRKNLNITAQDQQIRTP